MANIKSSHSRSAWRSNPYHLSSASCCQMRNRLNSCVSLRPENWLMETRMSSGRNTNAILTEVEENNLKMNHIIIKVYCMCVSSTDGHMLNMDLRINLLDSKNHADSFDFFVRGEKNVWCCDWLTGFSLLLKIDQNYLHNKILSNKLGVYHHKTKGQIFTMCQWPVEPQHFTIKCNSNWH